MIISKQFLKQLATRVFLVLILSFSLILSAYYFAKSYVDKSGDALNSKTREPIEDIEIFNVVNDQEFSIDLPENSNITSTNLSEQFVVENNRVTYYPSKYTLGNYGLTFQLTAKPYSENKTYLFNVIKSDVDFSSLNEEIISALGDQSDHYGIYIYDLLRDQEYTFQADNEFPPGSISKLPGVVLALRDIQEGIYTYEEPIMIKDWLKHSETDPLGSLPHGSFVTVKDLIEQSITISNNTAQYHLRDFIGGTDILNTRIEEELKSYPYYEDPQIASPRAVGTLFRKIYNDELLEEEYKEYFYQLLSEVVPSLREGVPLGLENENVQVLTKVGHIFTPDFSYNTYSDAGLVFGENTDYVIVILNDLAPAYPNGQFKIQELAQIINSYLN